MTNEEAAKERDRARQEASERADKERNQSTKERAQAVKEQNTERRQERTKANNALESGSADIKLAEIARQGGTVGRRLEREIRNFQQTGRVSSWLAGETIKAEAAQNAAQQSAFRQQVIDVVSSPSSPMRLGPYALPDQPLYKKPEVRAEGEGGDSCVGLALYTKTVGNAIQVWVGSGTVAGQLPSGFDPEEGKFIASGGSGNVWAEVNIDGNTGDILSIAVTGGGSTPSNSGGSYYYPLGYYSYNADGVSVSNYECGSLAVSICRNWFATSPPFYTLTFLGR